MDGFGWMDGWIYEWMDRWMDGWMDLALFLKISVLIACFCESNFPNLS